MRVDSAMSSPAVTATPDMSVKDAAELMAAHGFTLLPVVDDNLELVGVVSEGDLVHGRFPRDVRYPASEEAEPEPGRTVGEVMTTDVIRAFPWHDVRGLIARMREARIRAVPVCADGGKVLGVVTYQDLVRALARADDRILRDARRRLRMCFRPDEFDVRVQDGEVVLTSRRAHSSDWHTARTLVEQIPGVITARVVPGSD